jgi:carboxymethylenebutenolidase
MIDIAVPTSAGLMNAYRVRGGQGSPPRAPIVLIHEAFGLNDHIRSIADRLAERGHDVIAPHLYYRRTREPAAYDDVPLAVEMSKELSPADIVADLESAASVVSRGNDGRVVTIGFCFGGAVAYIGAALSDRVERAVSYYPVSILEYWDRVGPPQAPLLVYFGDEDEFLGPRERTWLADLGTDPATDVRIEVFPRAGHAFFNDVRPELYNAEPAKAAWVQTLDFIDQFDGARV